jgi:hypothetical protein
MNKLLKSTLLIGVAVLTMAATAVANQGWTVAPGSYISSDPVALTNLLRTPHQTQQYRHFREVLIARGLLQLTEQTTATVIATNGEISEIAGYRYSDGRFMAFYIPNEDLGYFLGELPSATVAPFSPVSPEED